MDRAWVLTRYRTGFRYPCQPDGVVPGLDILELEGRVGSDDGRGPVIDRDHVAVRVGLGATRGRGDFEDSGGGGYEVFATTTGPGEHGPSREEAQAHLPQEHLHPLAHSAPGKNCLPQVHDDFRSKSPGLAPKYRLGSSGSVTTVTDTQRPPRAGEAAG